MKITELIEKLKMYQCIAGQDLDVVIKDSLIFEIHHVGLLQSDRTMLYIQTEKKGNYCV